MSQFSARVTRTGNGIPIALDYCLGMFVNEFIFSFTLLSFAALLCLFGVVILIDGIKRLIAEWHTVNQPAPVNDLKREEKPSPGKQAA